MQKPETTLTRSSCKYYRIENGRFRSLLRILAGGAYCSAQEFDQHLTKAGAQIHSYGDAPGEGFTGTWNAPVQECHYTLRGKTLYAYVAIHTTIDDYYHEWVTSETQLKATEAADLIQQGRELSKPTHFLKITDAGQVRRTYQLCCDTDEEARAEADAITDYTDAMDAVVKQAIGKDPEPISAEATRKLTRVDGTEP